MHTSGRCAQRREARRLGFMQRRAPGRKLSEEFVVSRSAAFATVRFIVLQPGERRRRTHPGRSRTLELLTLELLNEGALRPEPTGYLAVPRVAVGSGRATSQASFSNYQPIRAPLPSSILSLTDIEKLGRIALLPSDRAVESPMKLQVKPRRPRPRRGYHLARGGALDPEDGSAP
jgi:hypothetical protein